METFGAASAYRTDTEDDRLLDGAQTRRLCGDLSHAGLYKAVKAGRLPAPVYVLSRKPGWWLSEVKAALEKTRATPTEQTAARKAARDAAIIAERAAAGATPRPARRTRAAV